MLERQELYCHNCNQYVQFNMDMELNGNHVLKCPVCGHEHCRVVKDGVITSDRWDSRNFTHSVSGNITYTSYSTYSTYSLNSSSSNSTLFSYSGWLNTIA